MSEKFTPEDVVAAYKRLDKKATPYAANLVVSDGVLRLARDRCCALGVMGDGLPCATLDTWSEAAVVARHYGLDASNFIHGFDQLPTAQDSSWCEDDPDYQLGRACRRAVIAAGLEITS